MTVTVKLFSDTTTARRDFTGEPTQVYEYPCSANWIISQVQAGNALSVFRVDGNCHWLHLVCPQVVNDIYGKPEWIVGNCSDVLGEFSLLKIHVTKLRYFAIIGQDAVLPVRSEVSESVPTNVLRGGPLATEEGAKIASLPAWLVAFKGSKLPQGDVRSDESEADMDFMGPGYKLWHECALKHMANERNDVLQQFVHDFKAAGTYERYVQPADSIRVLENCPMGSALQASAQEYPEAAMVIRKTFFDTPLHPPPCVPGAVTVGRTTVVVEDAREKEKEVVARQGKAKFSLINVGAKIDFDAGTVTTITYPIISKVMEGIFDMPRASRGGQFAQAMIRNHKKAKTNDKYSLFSTHASIKVFPKSTATNFLVGNFNSQTLDSLYGEAASIDCLIWAPQTDQSKINKILACEKVESNQSSCDVPVEQSTAPKDGVPRVGNIKSTLEFKKLLVNLINSGPVMVDVDAMEAAGSPHLLTTLAKAFLDVMDPDFDTWVEKTGGGRWIHALLLQYFDVCISLIFDFAVDFQNGNVFEYKRSTNELDPGSLTKCITVFQSARKHFRERIAIQQPCTITPAIAYKMMEEESKNQPSFGTTNVLSDATNQASTSRRSHANKGTTRGREVNAAEANTATAARKRTTFGARPDDYQQGDLKKKGMFLSNNPANAHLLLPVGCNLCADYVFRGRECVGVGGVPCPDGKKHCYSPHQINKKELDEIGDSFLAKGDGFFVKNSFRRVNLDPKHKALLETPNNRT